MNMPTFRQISYHLISKMHVRSDHGLVKFFIEKGAKYLSCLCANLLLLLWFCKGLSLTLPSGGLDSHSWSEYEEKVEEKGVAFNVCKYLKITLYSQIDHISRLSTF